MRYAAKKPNNGLKPYIWELFYYHQKKEKLYGIFKYGAEEQMK